MRIPHNEQLSSDIAKPLSRLREGGQEPERKCILSGEHDTRAALIRLAISPDGEVLPDVNARAPGRGAWIGVSREALENALVKGKLKGALARAFKGAALTIPEDLADRIEARQASSRKRLVDDSGQRGIGGIARRQHTSLAERDPHGLEIAGGDHVAISVRRLVDRRGPAVRRARGEAGLRSRPVPDGHQHRGSKPRLAERRQQWEWAYPLVEPPRQHPPDPGAVALADHEAGTVWRVGGACAELHGRADLGCESRLTRQRPGAAIRSPCARH